MRQDIFGRDLPAETEPTEISEIPSVKPSDIAPELPDSQPDAVKDSVPEIGEGNLFASDLDSQPPLEDDASPRMLDFLSLSDRVTNLESQIAALTSADF